ncbi:MAG: Zn-ribbon domain-containing OB-fold protein [Candidatus Aminicenantes bacterium]|nr:MAG: Zn-ribbon domain-containing OB-fold protein [Candidatus Aminicenantes bacterium]
MFSPARAWREYPQRYRLEAAKCAKCSKILYPPRLVCPECGGRVFTPETLPRDGKVVTYTVIRVPPAGFTEQTPLPLALVELSNGVRLMVQIGDVEDPATLAIGMPVRLEFRRISWDGEAGVIFYGHKAVRASV